MHILNFHNLQHTKVNAGMMHDVRVYILLSFGFNFYHYYCNFATMGADVDDDGGDGWWW